MTMEGYGSMAKCPNCGTDVAVPVKSWKVKPGTRKGPELQVKLFACPKCGKKFREAKKV
jgi:DNA-directed RNA polymerase subunit M/transcription elongation factor TFIIS